MTWRPFEQCKENMQATQETSLEETLSVGTHSNTSHVVKPITFIEPEEACAVCGKPRSPHNYRHIFRPMKSCSLHTNCAEADDAVRRGGGRWIDLDEGSVHTWSAKHE